MENITYLKNTLVILTKRLIARSTESEFCNPLRSILETEIPSASTSEQLKALLDEVKTIWKKSPSFYLRSCNCCGELFDPTSEWIQIRNNDFFRPVCKNCKSLFKFCESCNTYEYASSFQNVDGENMCGNCVCIKAFFCEFCQKYHTWDRDSSHAFNKDENYYANRLCKDCYEIIKDDPTWEICKYCNTFAKSSLMKNTAHGTRICQGCINANRVMRCDCCNQLFGDPGISIRALGRTINNKERWEWYCNTCVEENSPHLTACTICGTLYTNTSDFTNGTCKACRRRQQEECIEFKAYSYKPDPIFYKMPDETIQTYFGLELEFDGCGAGWKLRKAIFENTFKNEITKPFYFKEDASLNCGIEIVTHPMSYEFIEAHTEDFRTLLNIVAEYGAEDLASSSGLHIHISRAGFKNTCAQNLFCWAVHRFCRDWETIFERSDTYYCGKQDFSSTVNNFEELGDFDNELDHKGSRYFAVNRQNRATLEFRLPSSTTDLDHLLMQIQVAKLLADWANHYANLSAELAESMSLYNFQTLANSWDLMLAHDYIQRHRR